MDNGFTNNINNIVRRSNTIGIRNNLEQRSAMKRYLSKCGFQLECPLVDATIDSDLCIEVQDCIEGNIPIELQYEDFFLHENYKEICTKCEYHI